MKRLGAVLPMLLDMATPVISFYLLHVLLGVDPVLALTVGAAAAGVRTIWRAVRERRLNAFSLMMLFILAATVALVAITGDGRLVLAKSALIPAVGGMYGIVTTFAGRTLLYDVALPFVSQGDPRRAAAWRLAWETDRRFADRLRLLNLIWGIGFLVSAVARVVIVYHVPLNVAVLAGQIPTLGGLVLLAGLTKVMSGPLSSGLKVALGTRTAAQSVQADAALLLAGV
jgi:intracellular septation protein A